MIYHGVRQTAAGSLYRLGLALFALDKPDAAASRAATSWIFGPEAAYERKATSATSRFPAATRSAPTATRINLYYGAADTSIALATGSIRELLSWLDEHGRE